MKNYSVLLIGLLLVSEVTVSDPLSDDDIDRQISAYFSLMPTFIELREKLYSNEETRKKGQMRQSIVAFARSLSLERIRVRMTTISCNRVL